MRTRQRPLRRGGFTLIELLVVIAILAAMVGLTVGIIGSVRSGQQASTTEGTVKKLQVSLGQLRTAVLDEATSEKNPYLPIVTQWCDNDKDRAKAVLAYLYMKREFPQTFAEARANINLSAAPMNIPGGPTIPAHRAFSDLPAGTYSAEQEAAVLLQKIVTGKANRGTSVDSDGSFAGAETVVPGPGVKGFKDGYGNYIVFLRFANSNEMNAPPYGQALNNIPGHFDTLDPKAKLRNWPTAGTRVTQFLTLLNANAGASSLPANGFDGRNRMLTVISAGLDQNADPANPAGPGWSAASPDGWLGGDNVLGFRLAQFGAKGN